MSATTNHTTTDYTRMTTEQLRVIEREAGWEPAQQRALAEGVDTNPMTAALDPEMRASIARQLRAAAAATEEQGAAATAELERRRKAAPRTWVYVA